MLPAAVGHPVTRNFGNRSEPTGVLVRGGPYAKPAVAVLCASSQRGGRPSPHDYADARRGPRQDLRGAHREEFALVIEGCAGQQSAKHRQALIRAATTSGRIDTADLDLVAILPSDPYAQFECPGRPQRLRERDDLAGHRDRMAQGEEIHTNGHIEARLERRQRRCVHDAVYAPPGMKADVIGRPDVIETRVSHG